MKRLTTKLATLTVTFALAALPLTACGGSASTDTGTDEPSPAATQTTEVDPSSWATLSDAFASADLSSLNYGYDDDTFVCVFQIGDAYYRTVAKMVDEVHEKTYGLDMSAEDYDEQFAATVGELEILEAADITDELMSQEDIEQYVGKTGQDLVDAGFIFSNYIMYGGEETGADLDKGSFAYSFIFDTQVSEEQADSDSEGSLILGATVVEAQSNGNLSNAALDPAAAK